MNIAERTITELCKEFGPGVKTIYFDKKHDCWIMEFKKSYPLTFEDFQQLYEWATTEGVDY